MTAHSVTRYVEASGWIASCSCGWRTTSRTREQREQLAREHEAIDTLEVRRIETERAP
jgi:hypothetical protein